MLKFQMTKLTEDHLGRRKCQHTVGILRLENRRRRRIASLADFAEYTFMGIHSTVTVDLYWDLVFSVSRYHIQRFEVRTKQKSHKEFN